MLRLEKALDDGLERLVCRVQELRPDADFSETVDDLDSIASSNVNASSTAHNSGGRGVRFGSTYGEIFNLEKKVSNLEHENSQLRHEVDELRWTVRSGPEQEQ